MNSIRSCYRLCDGLQTRALVDKDGLLVEIIDVEGWALPFSDTKLPVPSPRDITPTPSDLVLD
ncbi:MAG TPA: hypothetical protein VNX60_02495 [Candidatus Acidoferrum sp.]|nr:hypothetical protein [Candidatus Acidoferrum sp.]